MGVSGVYEVKIAQFVDLFDMELHIMEDKRQAFASLKDRLMTRSFYNGRTILSPPEKESHNFIFYNAQIDNYTNLLPSGKTDPVNLTPPGGYHIGGVVFGGTVVNDILTATITLKNGLVCSVSGKRVEGEPIVNTRFRTDGLPGVNRFCPCQTGSCTHHGFCDSCHIFNSLHTPMFKGDFLPVEQCMMDQYEKLFGKIDRSLLEENAPEIPHGPHHLIEEPNEI